MRKMFLLLVAVLSLISCKEPKQDSPLPASAGLSNIDVFTEVEDIIADSALMNADGDKAWTKEENFIRVKNGDKYYLRKETDKEILYVKTYRYGKDSITTKK